MKHLNDFKIDFNKTIWSSSRSHLYQFYCPLCHVERRVPFRHRPGGIHYLQVGLTAAVLMLLTYPWWEWKGIVSFLPIWIAFESIYRLRMRNALVCEACGFDPLMFLVDQVKAKDQVEVHWKVKFKAAGIAYPLKPGEKPVVITAGAASSQKTDATVAPKEKAPLSAHPAKVEVAPTPVK